MNNSVYAKANSADLADIAKHHTATRYLLSQLKSGKSVAVLVVGDSTSTTSALWQAQFLKKIGQDHGCNVKHCQYNYAKTDYDAWESLNIAGDDRHIRTVALKSCRSLTGTEIVVTSADLDISIQLSLDLWKESKSKYILSRWGAAGSKCWTLFLGANNTFYLMWSTNGTDTSETVNFNSISTLNNVDGSPYWYRFTVDVDDGAGHYVAKLWTSTDGSTWTVAQTITGTNTTSIFNHATQSYGIASSSSPGGNTGSTVGNFYEVRIRNGIDGAIVSPQPIELWRQTETDTYNGQTIEGIPTIYIYNSALGGANLLSYASLTKYAPRMLMPVVLVSLGYNEGTSEGEPFLTSYEALITAVKGYVKNPIITVVSQAPTISPATHIMPHKMRVNELIGYAIINNYDNINMYDAFIDSGIPIANLVNSDGIHPNTAGQALMVDTAYKYLKY